MKLEDLQPCGLNADWSVSAWFLSGGKINMEEGYYIIDLEEEDNGIEQYAIVRRTFEDVEDPILSITYGGKEDILARAELYRQR